MESLKPFLDDEVSIFQEKIASNRENKITKYPIIMDKKTTIKDIANENIDKKFTISPHQLFVQNFLSPSSPYNGLLLFHGLGTGKTLSAIGLCELTRKFSNRIIFIVASRNIQQNLKTQFVDEVKIIQDEQGFYKSENPITQALIDEVNPFHNEITKEDLIKEINSLINHYYTFFGYDEFANYCENEINKKSKMDNILLVIDEVHNIGTVLHHKNVSNIVFKFIQTATNLKLLFMSATPIYNDPREVIFLSNMLNTNDKKPLITINQIFDSKGNINKDGLEILSKTLNGYISYVRSNNPYTFPYRMYPRTFNTENSILNKKYPTNIFKYFTHYNSIKYTDLYCLKMSPLQKKSVEDLTQTILDNSDLLEDFNEEKKGVGHTKLMEPIEAQTIVYNNGLTGKRGIKTIVDIFEEINPFSYKIKYKKDAPHIFEPDKIGNYSVKFKETIDQILKCNGIVLVYLQYITAGIIPFALSLEEAGFNRYQDSNLFSPSVNVGKNNGYYTIITGDVRLRPVNMSQVIQVINSSTNKRGKEIKVILISQSGAEGLDFKNIRQVHILNPWFNLNRIEQIIGRAIRNNSHMSLPFEERNTQIFMYCCFDEKVETLDMYLYRYAESKAITIGKITKLMKSISVDCLLNYEQSKYTQSNFQKIGKIEQKLGNGEIITDYIVGDADFSIACDFDVCNYKCVGNSKNNNKDNEDIDTTNTVWLSYTIPIVYSRLEKYFIQGKFYAQKENIYDIIGNDVDKYQAMYALNEIIKPENNKQYKFKDVYGRSSKLVNEGNIYILIPLYPEQKTSIFSPIPQKFDFIKLQINKRIIEKFNDKGIIIYTGKEPDINNITISVQIATGSIVEDVKKSDLYYWEKCANLLSHLFFHIELEPFRELVIYKKLDYTSVSKKLEYAIYILETKKLSDIWKIIKKYLDKKIKIINNKTYICLSSKIPEKANENKKTNEAELSVYELTENNQWVIPITYVKEQILIKFHDTTFFNIEKYDYVGIVILDDFKIITKSKSTKLGSAKCCTARKETQFQYGRFFISKFLGHPVDNEMIEKIDTKLCVACEICARLTGIFLDPEEALFYTILQN